MQICERNGTKRIDFASREYDECGVVDQNTEASGVAPVVGDTAAAPSMVEGAVLPDAAAGTGEVTSATASEMSSEAPAKEIVATADAAASAAPPAAHKKGGRRDARP